MIRTGMVRTGTRRLLMLALAGCLQGSPSSSVLAEGPLVPPSFPQGDEVLKGNRTGPGQALPDVTLTPEDLGANANTETPTGRTPAAETPARNPQPTPNPSSRLISSYYFLNHRGGDQFGQSNPDTVFGMFYPVNVENGIWFTVPQIAIDNNGNVGSSISFGRRWLAGPGNRMYGAAVSWDTYQTRYSDSVQQGVLSLETRGTTWDVFANGYLPVVNRTNFGGAATFGPVMYDGNNLVAGILRQAATSMAGGDLQIARRLGEGNVWGFGGWYHLEGGGEITDGFQTGVRGYLGDQILLDTTVSHDELFGTNVGFSATVFFGGNSRGRIAPQSVSQRMAEPLYRRDTTVQFEREVQTGTRVLTRGGNPVTVTHVDGSGVAGVGTAANPFGSLTNAAGSTTDIVFVHADSVFNGQQFTTQPGQQLLGEGNGLPHIVLTDQLGPTLLPRATAGTNAPTIMNAPGNAITLAGDSAISGFGIQNAGGAGIFGSSAGPILIDRVAVQGGAGPGVLLQVSGADVMDATVRNSVFSGNAAPSTFQFGANAGAVLNLNLFANDDSAGFALQRDANGSLRLGGTLGTGNLFNDDNGNVANNGNTTSGGAPNVIILGAGNQIQIVPPGSIVLP